MTPFGTYDFETYQWTKPLCIGLHWESEGKSGEDFCLDREDYESVAVGGLQMIAAIAKEHNVKTWWAHNGGKFDVLFFVDAIKRLPGWHCDGAVAGGRVISLRVFAPGVTFDLKDSFAVIQSSLSKALDSFDIPTKKVFTSADYDGVKNCQACDADDNHDFVNHSCMLSHNDAKLEEGCLADCKSLHMLLQKAASMFEEWGGNLKSTAPSSALTVIKHAVGKPLPSHEGNQWANDIARRAYCGGRVEVFKHAPNKLLREYDVTSSYPWSMSQKLPWELIGYTDKPDIYSEKTMSIVYATVNVPKQYVPPLPYVPSSGGLFFPYGTWAGWFTSIELAYAIESCGVNVMSHEAISYTVEKPFETFVAAVFADKAASSGARREFDKLILNSGYGKFGQKPETQKLKVFSCREDAIAFERKQWAQGKPIPEQISPDGTALAIPEFRWPKHTHYALASFITAYSRIKLHKYLRRANQDIAYCDTDSIHTPDFYLDKDCNAFLGGLKVELFNYYGRFYAPKLYKLSPRGGDAVYASKGFPVSAEAFSEIIQGHKVGNPNGRMQLLKTQLRSGNAPTHFDTDATAKAWSGRSNKRFALPNSPEGDTEPWNVRDLSEGRHIDQLSPIAFAKALPR